MQYWNNPELQILRKLFKIFNKKYMQDKIVTRKFVISPL